MRAAIRQESYLSLQSHLEQVLETELDQLQRRVLETGNGEFFFDVTRSAKEFLLLKGSEQRYSAERLKLAIERDVVYPLANLFATDQIQAGDTIRIDRDHYQPGLIFVREVTDLVTPLRHLEGEATAGLFLRTLGGL